MGCECVDEELLATVAGWHFGGRVEVERDEILEGVDTGIAEGAEV